MAASTDRTGPDRAEARSLQGCPVHLLRDKLRHAGLRPTRQRVSLGWLLFAKGDRHVSAEMLFDEAMKARVPVSLATVYNTLHQFTQAGLLRELTVDAQKIYFDTNPAIITISTLRARTAWSTCPPMRSSSPLCPNCPKAWRSRVSR